MIELIVIAGASAAGYFKSRSFVQHRLRYVDAAQTRRAPLIAGTVAMLAAAPIVTILPVIGGGTAILFGIAVGAGTRAGAGRIRGETRSYAG